jgi:16S rRNA C1402 (ribose-2'-O) methylase RsmI
LSLSNFKKNERAYSGFKPQKIERAKDRLIELQNEDKEQSLSVNSTSPLRRSTLSKSDRSLEKSQKPKNNHPRSSRENLDPI